MRFPIHIVRHFCHAIVIGLMRIRSVIFCVSVLFRFVFRIRFARTMIYSICIASHHVFHCFARSVLMRSRRAHDNRRRFSVLHETMFSPLWMGEGATIDINCSAAAAWLLHFIYITLLPLMRTLEYNYTKINRLVMASVTRR